MCWYDTLHFDWKTFKIVLRDKTISLPLEKTLYFMKIHYIRKIFHDERSLYRLLVHNPESCKTRILYDFTQLKVPNDMYVTINEIRSRRQLLTKGSLTPPSTHDENESIRPNDNILFILYLRQLMVCPWNFGTGILLSRKIKVTILD